MISKQEEWKIYQIYDVNKALRKQYEDGYVSVRTVSPSESLSDSIMSDFEKINDDYLQEQRGKFVKREVFEFPLAKKVILAKGKIHTKSWQSMSIIIRSDRFPSLYDLLGAYYKGTRISSRQERYRNLYQVYEELSNEQDQELKAIRHSLSHPRKRLTSKKTIETLRLLFGDTKVNLQIYKHAKVFREKYKELKSESEPLLVKKILKIIPSSPNFLDRYYMP